MGLFEKAFIRRIITKDAAVEDGGKGSGNFGHKGRPGLRGGSGKGGGKEYRAETKETASGYIGVQRAKSFRNMARNARANKDSFDNFIGSLSKEHISAIRDQMEACGTKENFAQYSRRMFDIMANYSSKAPSQARKVVEGKDIITTYRRDNSLPNEIDSIIHQQGFDGLPKVVSDKEFKEIVKAHPEMPLMYRSYSGIDSEEVQDYDDMLENGKWYVDCGTGGAGHGQGMYCAAIYGDKTPRKMDGAMNEMKHYRKINEDRKANSYDLTPLVTPGMKYRKTGDNKFREYDPNNVMDTATNPPKPGEMFVASRFGSVNTRFGNVWVLADDGQSVYRVYDDGSIDASWANSLGGFQDYIPLGEEKTIPKFKPVSASREMTLDPSAKIIKKADIEDEWKKHITAANKAAEKAVKAQAEEAKRDYETKQEAFRQSFGETAQPAVKTTPSSNKRETAKKFNDLLDKSVEERREGLADATKALADMPEGSVITTLLERGTRRDYTKKADGTWDASIQDYNAEPQNMSDDRMAKNILGAGKWGGTPAIEVVVRKNGQNTSVGFGDKAKEAQTLQSLLPKVSGQFRKQNEAAIQAGDILERAPVGTYLEMERSDGRRRYVYKKLGEGDWGNANTVARTHYGSDEVVNELHEGSYSGDWTCRFVDKPQNWNYTK